ncbi:MAG TPA: R3H domain-containing nucleic acid-binding protein [Terriglobia bacterium]|nr:R3H domain-containing nucleic acid-binding protein [Terriglobia bacterium]
MTTESQPEDVRRATLESFLPRIEAVLREVIGKGGFQLSFKIGKGKAALEGVEPPEFVVDLSGPDSDLLLQKHAAFLDALEYVVLKAARLDEDLFGRIGFDCEDWRWLRAQELQMAARVAAEQVLEGSGPFAMSPMTARERRIIHLALKGQPRVSTASEGFGRDRHVVIRLAPSPAPTNR